MQTRNIHENISKKTRLKTKNKNIKILELKNQTTTKKKTGRKVHRETASFNLMNIGTRRKSQGNSPFKHQYHTKK